MLKKIFISILFVLAALIGILQIDDELHPEASAWVEQIENNGDSPAYYYLMGIFAKSDENPLDVGLQRYQVIRAWQERSTSDEFEDYPDEKKLPIPTGALFCKYWEAGCVQNLLKTESDIPALLLEHSVLLERYRKFMAFDEFRSLLIPTVTEPFPDYQYLMAGHRLESLALLDKAINGAPQEAVDRLINIILKLKGKIEQQDALVGKIVLLQLLAEKIDLTSMLIYQYKMPMTESLSLITKAERDFKLPMQREFYMGYVMHRNLDKNPEFFQQGRNMPGWIVRILFKPNINSNDLFSIVSDVVDKSRLDQKSFAEFIALSVDDTERGFSFRNYIGNVLSHVAKPTYMEFVAKFHDVNCKIVLFNNMSLIKENKLDIIENPYGLNDRPFFSEDGRKICFDGPFEDDRNLRCLTVHF